MAKKLEILHGIVKLTMLVFRGQFSELPGGTLSEIIKSVEDLHMEC